MSILNEFGQPYTTPTRLAHGAERNPYRGPLFPTRRDDIDKLISVSDLTSLRSLSSRLFINFGVCRDAISQKARYSIGNAWNPAYVGESDFVDGKQISTFMRKVWFPNMNVKGGVFNWQKTLEVTSQGQDINGDVFWVKVLGKDNFPRIQVVPAHRVGNGGDNTTVGDGKWKGFKISDGVILYASGRPAAYRVLTGEQMRTFVDVDAKDVIHIFDPDFAEQNRGYPAFMHAIEDMLASLSSTGDERIRQQIISRLHLNVHNETGGPNTDDPMVQMLRGSTAAATATTADTYVAKAMPGGIVYHQSGSGDKMEQMRHENPGEVWESFQNRMIRQSLASVWPAALVWMSAGQGTAERSEIIKARGYIRTRQRDLTMPALQAFAWAYSVFQQQGRVPELDHPFSWEFSKPARLSVDDGRESKMELEEWRAGARNMGQIQEAHGGAGIEEFYLERAHEAALRKVIARRVSEEYSASSGYEIKVEDREMALITPNEVPPPETSDSPEKENQPDKDKQDEDSDT